MGETIEEKVGVNFLGSGGRGSKRKRVIFFQKVKVDGGEVTVEDAVFSGCQELKG